jgi:hypothetical protein
MASGGGGGLGLMGGTGSMASAAAINICDDLDKFKAIQAKFQALCDAKNS